jgi:NADPH:quinone reductase-like Zn-dependent oxidoreductase
MKAAVYLRYGGPEVLSCEDVAVPVPGDGEVLIRIRAASVNPLDWHFLRGRPWLMRLGIGLRTPRLRRLGVDVAGTIEAIGRSVSRFKPGDAVFGSCRGSLAEFGCTQERALALKPERLTFEQAAAIPVAGITALQALRDHGKLVAGQKIIINGASGGVGTFAVQIAKALGAEVTGVCSASNVDLVRTLGADHVIDYTRSDFTQGGARYDLMLDCVGNRSLADCRRILTSPGTYVMVGGPDGPWLGPLARGLRAMVTSWLGRQKLTMMLAKLNQADFEALVALIEVGKLVPVIDRSYPLSDLPEAIRYLETGHARGKVVIAVDRSAER